MIPEPLIVSGRYFHLTGCFSISPDSFIERNYQTTGKRFFFKTQRAFRRYLTKFINHNNSRVAKISFLSRYNEIIVVFKYQILITYL